MFELLLFDRNNNVTKYKLFVRDSNYNFITLKVSHFMRAY